MKIAFVSSFLNHHQLLLCQAFNKSCDEFCYLATEQISEERRSLGYEDLNTKYDFVVRTYDEDFSESKLRKILIESDVVIFGACPDSYIEMRLKENRLSFIYSERFFKKGVWRRFIPSVRKKLHKRILQHKGKNLYVLCASGFLPYDLKLCSFDTSKCLRWGYFPQVSDRTEYQERTSPKLRLLWAGRMLPLKRAQDVVKAAAYLKKHNVDFTLDFIGEGNCEAEIRALVKHKGLEQSVRFLGSMSPDKVKENMASSDVFLMTSNFREGWGAVVNEAMSEGCAVLVSSAVGSASFLVQDGKNGMIYKYGSQRDMNKKLLALAMDKKLRDSLGKEAFLSIRGEYSAEVAVERLVAFVESGNKKEMIFNQGPVSAAPVIKNKWYK